MPSGAKISTLSEDLQDLPPCEEGSPRNLPLLSALRGHVAGVPNMALLTSTLGVSGR